MIGKPQWFTYRIFGWGINPKTWQGWAYILISMLITGMITVAPVSDNLKMWIFGIFIGAIFLDVLHIMLQLQKYHDERENLHQLMIERNVSFAAVCAIIGVMLFQTYQNREILDTGQVPFDLSLGIVLGIMVAVKGLSSIYVRLRL